MMLLVLHAAAVTAPVVSSLSRLIVSARVNRGYAPEDRLTRIKTLDAYVDSLPHLGQVVPIVIKATMLGYHDMCNEERKLSVLSAKLLAMELKGVRTSRDLHRTVLALFHSLPKEVTRITKDLVACHKQLSTWNDEMDSIVASLFSDLRQLVQDTLTILGKQPTESKVKNFGDSLHKVLFRPLCDLFAENLQSAIATTSRTPAMTYELTAKNNKGIAIYYSEISLVDRLHKELFCHCVPAKAGVMSHLPLSFLSRLLSLDKLSFVSQRFAKYHCFPDLPLTCKRFPGDETSLLKLDTKNEDINALQIAIDIAMDDFHAAGNAAKHDRSMFALKHLTDTVRVMKDIKRRQEVLCRELEVLRQDHYSQGYAYFARQASD